MKFTDMDMLQDYEKDARMATLAYAIIETEVIDTTLHTIFRKIANEAAASQKRAANLILARGDRP